LSNPCCWPATKVCRSSVCLFCRLRISCNNATVESSAISSLLGYDTPPAHAPARSPESDAYCGGSEAVIARSSARVGATIRRRIGSRPRPSRETIGAREALLLKRSFVLSPLMSSGVYSVDYRSARFSISPRQPEANVAFVRGPRRAPPLALRIQVTLDG
jgi:hypothetical protein